MRNNRELLARLDALEHRLIPPIERKIAKLTASERAIYQDWRKKCSDQAQKYTDQPGRYYELIIEGEITYPILPYWIRDKIYNPKPTITIHMTDEQVSDAYRKYMENGQ